ncbi:MAG: hybrid sensor histidine kinase/response regulator [Archangiaceae bacterium]|nr:hybrid sensor histidine kinase/response regulator [Archangiaceae bacterium]
MRALAEIALELQSSGEPAVLLERVLELTRRSMGCARASVRCTVAPAPELVVSPAPPPAELLSVRARLDRMLGKVSDPDATPVPPVPRGALVVPLAAHGRVEGVLVIDCAPDVVFEEPQRHMASVVAALLCAYVDLLRLRAAEADGAHELAVERDFHQQLVNIIAHELRNPLSGITVGTTGLLRRPADAATARTLERTLRCARRANRIISELLDATTAGTTGTVPVSRERVELKAMVNAVVDELRITQAPFEVAVQLPDEEVWGEWDSERLSQAVADLVRHGVQHGHDGATAQVRVEAEADSVQVRVTHQGEPISQGAVELLFNPFKPTVQRKPRGLGLGLYLARHVAAAHGGKVELHAQAPHGTSFVLEVPRRPSVTGGPVLVIDHDPDTRAAIADLLEAHGYATVTAGNGARALQLLGQGLTPRLVLFELASNEGDGFYRQCQEDARLRQLPMVALSSDRVAAARLAEDHAVGFVAKPVQVEQLLEAVLQPPRVRPRSA